MLDRKANDAGMDKDRPSSHLGLDRAAMMADAPRDILQPPPPPPKLAGLLQRLNAAGLSISNATRAIERSLGTMEGPDPMESATLGDRPPQEHDALSALHEAAAKFENNGLVLSRLAERLGQIV